MSATEALAASSRESCTCSECVSRCHAKPGWMKPGEAERIAEYLNVPLAQLFAERLNVDWWEADATLPETFVLSPSTVEGVPGCEFPYVAHGTCVFLDKDSRCSIHAVKPFECAVAWCGDGQVDRAGSAHEQVAKAWANPDSQAQIVSLLGHEPTADAGDPFAWVSLLFGPAGTP